MIIINNGNTSKIAALLDEEQGKCRERTVSVEDICEYPHKIMEELKIPMKALEGSAFWCDPNAQDFPNAYKFPPKSTQFRLVVSGGKWRLDRVSRTTTRKNGYGKEVESILSETAKEAILERFAFLNV